MKTAASLSLKSEIVLSPTPEMRTAAGALRARVLIRPLPDHLPELKHQLGIIS
jgi:hypothetical protein